MRVVSNEFARIPRTGLKAVVVVLVLSAVVATLSHFVFTPWEFDPESAAEASRSAIPRVAIRP